MSGRASLYITNWSLREPLCQSQSVPYLKALAAKGYRSCLMTCERQPYNVPAIEIGSEKRKLADAGVCWHPVPYHSRASMVGVIVDAVRMLWTAVLAVVRHRPRIVHTRTSVPAALGLLVARLTRRPFLYDADSELSEEYADGGHWSRRSFRYRALSTAERLCRRHADAIIVLTDRLRQDFVRRGVRAPITVIPCCVDTERFRFDPAQRIAVRSGLGLGDETVLVYAGKAGPRYMIDETMMFVAAMKRIDPSTRMLVLTHEDAAAFEAVARRHGVGDALIVRAPAPDDVPRWLSAADAGMALIRPTRSEEGSSPIKISEYLASGLPVVTTPSIGDLSAAIESRAAGVIIREVSAADAAALQLRRLLDAGPTNRDAGSATAWDIDIDRIGAARYAAVYDRLSEPATSDAVDCRGAV